jgi:hypothetical protein
MISLLVIKARLYKLQSQKILELRNLLKRICRIAHTIFSYENLRSHLDFLFTKIGDLYSLSPYLGFILTCARKTILY